MNLSDAIIRWELYIAGHVDIAEMLLKAGADVSWTMSGKTAREIAVNFDNLDIADLIDRLTV